MSVPLDHAARRAHLTPVGGRPRANLPAEHSPLIGREREIAQIVAMLSRPEIRLLTLIGPGGVGKTRMAMRAAIEARDAFPDGCWFVPLAAVRDPARLLWAIAATIGVRESGGRSASAALIDWLASQRVLLVLDNLEQVAAGPVVAELLSNCPAVSVLATSRIPLRIRAERRFQIAPLAVPDLEHVGDAGGDGAVALFLDRMQAIRPEFIPTPRDLRLIAEICVRLDGLPLALELAAARTNELTLPALHRALLADATLSLLATGPDDLPERQRTLRDTVAWSYDLLPDTSRHVFRRLSVFPGSFDADAAIALGYPRSEPWEHADLSHLRELVPDPELSRLVDVSLVRRESESEGGWRYAMLQTVRDVGRELLAQSGEEQTIQVAHADFYAALAQRAEPALVGPDQRDWLHRLDAEQANLEEALDTLVAFDLIERALQMATALWRYWESRGRLNAGRARLEAVLNAVGAGRHDISLEIQAKALNHLGNLTSDLGEYARAEALYRQALSLRRDAGDLTGVADTLNNLGLLAGLRGDYEAAIENYEESLAIRRAVNDRAGVALALSNLGDIAVAQGDADRGLSLHDQSLAIREALGDLRRIAYSYSNRGEAFALAGDRTAARRSFDRAVALFTEIEDTLGLALARHHRALLDLDDGNLAAAAEQLIDSLKIRHDQDDQLGSIDSLEAIAALLVERGAESQVAVRLCGMTAAYRARAGTPRSFAGQVRWDRTVDRLRQRKDQDAFDRVWAEGAAQNLEIAISEALQALFAPIAMMEHLEPEASVSAEHVAIESTQPGVYPAGLSAREVEVLQLVAAGHTNAEIAARLFLSVTTINAHLRRIYPKLGVTTRSAATRFATEHGLVTRDERR